jgi:hypothetical protein
LERGKQLILPRHRGRVANLGLVDMRLCARDQFPARALLHLEGRRDLGIRRLEDVAQKIGRALLRCEPLEHEEERRGEGRRKLHVSLGIRFDERLDRLGQPRTDIAYAGTMGGPEQIERAARAGGSEPRRLVLDRRPFGLRPTQERVLHRILGLRVRAEDAVGQAQELGSGLRKDALVVAPEHVSAARC